MIPEQTDRGNLDMLTFLENIFETQMPGEFAEHRGNLLGMEQLLERQLWNQRPNADAAALLRILAEGQQRPELAEGLDGIWRREQISAIVRDIFRKQASPIELHEMLVLPRPQRFGERPRRLRYSVAREWRTLLPTKASAVFFGVVLILILLYCRLLR